MYEDFIKKLRDYAEWAKANEWEVPIDLSDTLTDAANIIEADDLDLMAEEFDSIPEGDSLYW